MTIASTAEFHVIHAPQLRRTLEMLRGAMLWLSGVAGAFVFMEPSPYEIMLLVTIVLFMASGLALRSSLLPLAGLLILCNLGFAIAVVPVLDQPKTLLWVLTSIFLAFTAIFFAAMLSTNTEARLSLLLRGYTIAALIAVAAGIAGYFHIVPSVSGIFLLYDRVRGTFNDPNVFGAFLVLPALLAFQRILANRFIDALRASVLLLVLMIGLFLSFSRGAWGQFVFASIMVMMLTFITSRSPRERMRIVLIAVLGTMVLAALIAALLSIDQVAELFKQRAALEQSYDEGPTGRFGRHVLGFLLALDKPLGIGPLQFHFFFPEDPHNSYLNAFMSGGWLAGFAYLTLVAVTLISGLRFVFVTTPWRATYIVVYAAFVGTAAESAIIDTDHWRHYFLIMGVLWGLMTASRAYLPARRRPPVRNNRGPAVRSAAALARAAAPS